MKTVAFLCVCFLFCLAGNADAFFASSRQDLDSGADASVSVGENHLGVGTSGFVSGSQSGCIAGRGARLDLRQGGFFFAGATLADENLSLNSAVQGSLDMRTEMRTPCADPWANTRAYNSATGGVLFTSTGDDLGLSAWNNQAQNLDSAAYAERGARVGVNVDMYNSTLHTGYFSANGVTLNVGTGGYQSTRFSATQRGR